MIKKLYDLKKNQTDQKLMEKGQILSKIDKIDTEIMLTQNKINTATVQKFGAVSDFTILTMHKNTMRSHIDKLEREKIDLNTQLEELVQEIIELQKQTEQYGYILEEEKNKLLKKVLLAEQEASEEFIQSKYIQS